jgi:hypothetical protein
VTDVTNGICVNHHGEPYVTEVEERP